MIAKQEIREERNDVFSFWELKKSINGFDEIIETEEKVDECTLIDLEKRIEYFQQQIIDLNAKIELENSKINLVNALANA